MLYLTSELLEEFENFLYTEHEVFERFPDIYDQVPYSSKVAKKTPAEVKDKKKNPEKGKPKQKGQNYVNDMLTRFRSFIIWANENGYTNNNPFKTFKVDEAVYGSPIYISNEERNILYNADLSEYPDVAVQRDILPCKEYILN